MGVIGVAGVGVGGSASDAGVAFAAPPFFAAAPCVFCQFEELKYSVNEPSHLLVGFLLVSRFRFISRARCRRRGRL